jgi:hypothetical protein
MSGIIKKWSDNDWTVEIVNEWDCIVRITNSKTGYETEDLFELYENAETAYYMAIALISELTKE